MTYIYVLENFAYSDFEYVLLAHEKHYTKSKFKEIVKEAMNKIDSNTFYWNDWGNLQNILEKEYGFEDADIVPVVHIGDLQKEMEK